MKYLFLLHRAEDALPAPGSPEALAMFAAYGAAVAAMAKAGMLIDCAPLAPISSSTTVRVRGGETILTDGPAAELKEQVGGYTIVEWAATMPSAKDTCVEVRPIVDTGRR